MADACDARAGLPRTKGAAFQPGLNTWPVGPGCGYVVHDAADGVRAVERALLAAQDFDLGHLVGQKAGEIEAVLIGVADLDPVDQNQGVVGFGAANADVGQAADRAGAAHLDTRDIAQHIGEDLSLARRQFRRGDHGDRRPQEGAIDTGRVAGGGDHHFAQRGGVSDGWRGLREGGRRRQEDCGQHSARQRV